MLFLDKSRCLSLENLRNDDPSATTFSWYVPGKASDFTSSTRKNEIVDSDNVTVIMYHFNPFPDDRVLDRSKFKQIADNILKCI